MKWLKDNWKAIVFSIAIAVIINSVILLFPIKIKHNPEPAPVPRIIDFQSYSLTAADGRPQTEYVMSFITPDGIVIEANFKITDNKYKEELK